MLHIEHILNGWIIGYMYYNLNKAILDIYTCVCACMNAHLVVSDSLWPRGLYPARLLFPRDFLVKNTGVDCHFFLQGIFSTQGLNLHLLHLLHLQAPGKPYTYTYLHAKSLQSCLTLCDPMDCSPPGSCVHGILQARTLEWVAMPSSRESSQLRDQIQVS